MYNIFEARFCIEEELFDSNTRQSRQFNTSSNFCNGRYWYSNSAHLFVCPGHSRIMSKRLNGTQRWSKLFHRRIAPSFRLSDD